jgi:hypothetical protein
VGDFIDKIAREIVGGGLSSEREISGCTDAEIRNLEKHFDLKLPEIYRDFLRKMGRGAGLFLRGTDAFYNSLFGNREAMEVVLELDDCPFSISKEAFVFSNHQGYVFHFFDTSDGSVDPRVYGYLEGTLKTQVIDESFSAFLRGSVLEEVEGWGRVKNKA